jgi:hypothetical protein
MPEVKSIADKTNNTWKFAIEKMNSEIEKLSLE